MKLKSLDKCAACGYPVDVEMCRGLPNCYASADVLFGPLGPRIEQREYDPTQMLDESVCHTIFADDALDLIQKELDEAQEALRVMRAQRDDWQGQAAQLKKEVKMLRRKLGA